MTSYTDDKLVARESEGQLLSHNFKCNVFKCFICFSHVGSGMFFASWHAAGIVVFEMLWLWCHFLKNFHHAQIPNQLKWICLSLEPRCNFDQLSSAQPSSLSLFYENNKQTRNPCFHENFSLKWILSFPTGLELNLKWQHLMWKQFRL